VYIFYKKKTEDAPNTENLFVESKYNIEA